MLIGVNIPDDALSVRIKVFVPATDPETGDDTVAEEKLTISKAELDRCYRKHNADESVDCSWR